MSVFILVEVTRDMTRQLAQEAVNHALSGDWEKAIEINDLILKEDSDDVDALNRKAKALAEIGKLKLAKETAQKVLKIDPFNSIAQKSIKKWSSLKGKNVSNSGPSHPQNFLEEPGKTKIVKLLYLGAESVLAQIDNGDEVLIKPSGHRLTIETIDGKHVGRLPDDLSARLKRLINHGNEYQVFVKSADTECVIVFIREVKRSEKLKDVPSFSAERIDYVSFTPPELVHKKDDMEDDASDEEE